MSASRAEAVDPAQVSPSESQFRTLLEEWRRGWRPGLAAIIGLSLGYTMWLHLSSFFVEPLQQAFGWSRGEIALANSMGAVTGFAAPFLGRLVDRIGAKPVAIFGVAMSAMSFAALSQLNGSLTYYYAAYFFLVLSGMATTGLTYARIVVGTFTKSRGTSLAFMRVGLAISQGLMPMLVFPVIVEFGFTGGYLLLAMMNGFVTLPIIFFLVPGTNARADTGHEVPAARAPTHWRLLLRQPKILIISLAAMLHTAPLMAIITQLKPLGMSVGLTPAAAAGAVSVLGIAPIIGALIAGIFVDRLWAPGVAFVMAAVSAVGCLMLVALGSDISPILFYLSVILIGVGQGGESDVLGYIVARYFGLRDYATIAGMASLFVVVGIAAAASLIGHAYDVFGDYRVAVILAAISIIAAGLAFLMMGKYPEKPEE